jgi:hypothetical protein
MTVVKCDKHPADYCVIFYGSEIISVFNFVVGYLRVRRVVRYYSVVNLVISSIKSYYWPLLNFNSSNCSSPSYSQVYVFVGADHNGCHLLIETINSIDHL